MRSTTRFVRHLSLATLVVALAAGCASASAQGQPPNTTGVANQDCQRVAQLKVAAGTPVLAAVVDGTASGRSLGEAPGIGEALAAAQHQGQALVLVAVNGPGAQPPVLGPVALDPDPGSDSVVADRARQIALQCAQAMFVAPALRPSVPGSDVLAAVSAAVRQMPAAMLVVSDGVGTGSAIDPARIGWQPDPAAITAQVRAVSTALPAAKTPVTWIGMGETATPLPEGARAGLAGMWTALMQADGAVMHLDTRTGSSAVRTTETLPADTVTLPVPAVVTKAQATCLSVPATLMFAPDSTTLASADALAPVVQALGTHPDWATQVDGHAADFGTPAGRAATAQGRADAVMAALRSAGVTGPIVATGHGADQPKVNEWPQGSDGPHDLKAAEANRRVEVRYGPVGALAAVAC